MNREDFLNHLDEIYIYFNDEDYERNVKSDVVFEEAYNLLKNVLEFHSENGKVSRNLITAIGKEYSSHYGYCRNSRIFMENFCKYVVYKENLNYFDDRKIYENVFSKLSKLITAFEPVSVASLAEKLEFRRIWKGLYNEFVRKFIKQEDHTLINAKNFLIWKNFHSDFVDLVYGNLVKQKRISMAQQKTYTGKETLLFIEDLFKEIAKETLKRGGLKFVSKATYDIENDPFVNQQFKDRKVKDKIDVPKEMLRHVEGLLKKFSKEDIIRAIEDRISTEQDPAKVRQLENLKNFLMQY